MTVNPIEPQDPDLEPDAVPGDDPEVPTDPDQQEPDIVTEPNAADDIAAPDPVEDK
jgi:hypothetical protein